MQGIGKQKTLALLQRSHDQLTKRLATATGLHGPGEESFTVTHMRAVLNQVRAVLVPLKLGMKGVTLEQGKQAADMAASNAAMYLQRSEQRFAGSTERLNLDLGRLVDRSVAGTESSILNRLMHGPDPSKRQGILDRYGQNVVDHFEDHLQQRVIQRTPWGEVRQQLTDSSPFLQGAPAHWAERIVRTETMHAENRAANESIVQANQQLGDMCKIISSTFDSRTGADSYAVHGQIRRPSESFQSWFGSYPHPPDRPNDRSIVVPHRISWPIPGELIQKDGSAIAARWSEEGRTGSPPGRPLMSTIPMGDFGKAPPPTEQANADTESTQDEPTKELAPAIDRRVAEQSPGSLRGRWPEELPDEPEEPTAVDLMQTKIANATGSNPGGIFEGSDKVRRYVKLYSDPVQAFGEHLANSLYSDLGLGGVNSQVVFTADNKPMYASEIKPDVQTLGSQLEQKANYAYTAKSVALAKRALDGFAADVLMANWDAAGLNLDNMLVDSKGAITRIDNGAAFLTRAQGALKPAHALNNPTEWESLLDPQKNPAYAKLARIAGVTKPEDMAAQIRKGVKQIVKVRDAAGGWEKYVDDRIPQLNVDQRAQMIDMLDARTKFLEEKVAALPKAVKAPKKTKPTGVEPGSLKPITKADLDEGDINYDANLSGATRFLRKHPDLPHLEAYTGSAYKEIDRALAGLDRKTLGEQRLTEILNQAGKIQKLLAEAKADGHAVEGTLWRGFKGNAASVKRLMDGDVHEFKGFTSMSSHERVARSFADSDKPVLMRIRQRSAIPIDTVSRCKGEYEALLPAGTKFQIISRETHMHDGKEWLHVDVQEL